MQTEKYIVLNRWFTCPLSFFKCLKKEILFIVPAVPPGILFTTEQLCGEDFWEPLSKWKKTLAGACMDYLVENGLVPFENVPRSGRNPYPLQYRIKASYTSNS
jgi:hypothetical protein